MNHLQWFITLAGVAGDTLATLGQPSLARVFAALGKVAESGGDVEAHMAVVKAKLETGTATDADWDKVGEAIAADQDRIDRA